MVSSVVEILIYQTNNRRNLQVAESHDSVSPRSTNNKPASRRWHGRKPKVNDTDRIAFIERSESVVSPATDDRGMLTRWVAHCDIPQLVSVAGKSWRDAVDALAKEMGEG